MITIKATAVNSTDECRNIMLNGITIKRKSYVIFTPSVFMKNEIVGELRDNNIWLQKTKFKLYAGLSRIFVGKIVNESGGVIIVGKFAYTIFHKVISLAIALIILAVMYNTGLFTPTFSLVSVLIPTIFAVVIFGYFSINTVIHRKDELEVIEFIKHMLT